MSDNAEYDLMEPFDIDNGELDGLRPQECFVLGVEWQMCAALADTGKAWGKMIHLMNLPRIEAMLNRRGLEHVAAGLNMDASLATMNDWVSISVEAM